MRVWNDIKTHPDRFLKTLTLYTSTLTAAILNAIVGPCLLDLRQQVKTDVRTVSFSLTAGGFGHVIGALAGELLSANHFFGSTFSFQSEPFITS